MELEHRGSRMQEDALWDEHESPERRQAWCDLQHRRSMNFRQIVELNSQILFAEEWPGVERICFCPDVSDPSSDSESDMSE